MNLHALYRIVTYFCAGTFGVLILGTISQRLIVADHAWMYLAIGGGLGLVMGVIDPIARRIPGLALPLTMTMFSAIVLVISLVIFVGVRVSVTACSMNWAGVVLGSVFVLLTGMFLRALVDVHHA